MPSNLIKIILALTGLSPALLLLYIVKIINGFHSLSIYISVKSFPQAFKEVYNLIQNHYLFVLFIVLVIIARRIVKFAKNNCAVGRIEVKSVKPGDINFTTVIFSIILSLAKFYNPNLPDAILIATFVITGLVFGLIMKSSYHFNLTLKLILGYSHYEVQTKEEITYLMLSKKQLINRKGITHYVKLADHMLLNVSEKP
jgi:hypothetical protein